MKPGHEISPSELRSREMGMTVGCSSRASVRGASSCPGFLTRSRLPTRWYKRTVRARLAGARFGTERARLARVGF